MLRRTPLVLHVVTYQPVMNVIDGRWALLHREGWGTAVTALSAWTARSQQGDGAVLNHNRPLPGADQLRVKRTGTAYLANPFIRVYLQAA